MYPTFKYTHKLSALAVVAMLAQMFAVGQSSMAGTLIGVSNVLLGVIVLAVVYHLRRSIVFLPQERILQLKDPITPEDVQVLINVVREHQDKALNTIRELTWVWMIFGASYVVVSMF